MCSENVTMLVSGPTVPTSAASSDNFLRRSRKSMAAVSWQGVSIIPILLLTLSLLLLAILIVSLPSCRTVFSVGLADEASPVSWPLARFLLRPPAYGARSLHKTHVCMTSLPARMRTTWWLKNLKDLLTQVSPRQLRLYVPVMTKSTREPYVLLPELETLQGEHFTIVRVPQDEGPATKVRPALRDVAIGEADTVIVVDDDIAYKDGVFALLEEQVRAHPESVAAMCSPMWEGYKGMAFQKRLLRGLSEGDIPEACFRVDDVFIASFLHRHGIPVRAVLPPTGERGWDCSMHSEKSDSHPPWDELKSDMERRRADSVACTAATAGRPSSG